MAGRVLKAKGSGADELRAGIAAIEEEQHLPRAFAPEVEAAAEQDAAAPRLPERDLTDLPFVTIDPEGAQDLDQAMHLTQDGEGFVLHYAIADVMAFVHPGDPVDVESRARGESLYGADTKIPLHPKVLSEGAASLLPDQERPAFVWTIALDADGAVTSAAVERARVRSTAQLTYEGIEADLDSLEPGSTPDLLRTVGRLRMAQEAARGGVSLPMPSQEIEVDGDTWRLEYRRMASVEDWNAQISLLTGFAAASMMLEARVGILRTLPPAPDSAVRRLRRTARALGVDWPADVAAPEFIRGPDPSVPAEAAMVVACTAVLRGAGYAAFDGEPPTQTQHAALASSYAHVTAPLRRLVDRYGLEVCAAVSAGSEVPAWVRAGLAELPQVMQESGHRAHAYENAVLNLAEAHVLEARVGEQFEGVVLEVEDDDERRGTVMVREPAVEARVDSEEPLPVGEQVTVTLTQADPATRTVRFRR